MYNKMPKVKANVVREKEAMEVKNLTHEEVYNAVGVLDDLEPGDTVTFTKTSDGRVYHDYTACEGEVLESDVDVNNLIPFDIDKSMEIYAGSELDKTKIYVNKDNSHLYSIGSKEPIHHLINPTIIGTSNNPYGVFVPFSCGPNGFRRAATIFSHMADNVEYKDTYSENHVEGFEGFLDALAYSREVDNKRLAKYIMPMIEESLNEESDDCCGCGNCANCTNPNCKNSKYYKEMY